MWHVQIASLLSRQGSIGYGALWRLTYDGLLPLLKLQRLSL